MSTDDYKPESDFDPKELGPGLLLDSLPERVATDLRSAFGAKEAAEVPEWVGLAVLEEFQGRQQVVRGRQRSMRFAAIAAALALAITAGMRFGNVAAKRPVESEIAIGSPAMPGGTGGLENRTLAMRKGFGEDLGRERAAVGATPMSAAPSPVKYASKTGASTTSNLPSEEIRLAKRAVTLDLDHNGRTDILDALMLAKTILDPGFFPGLDLDTAKQEEPVGILLAKAESTWDLTHDGTVDDKDVDALVAEIVKIGGA